MHLHDDRRRTRATLGIAVVVAAVLHVGFAFSIPKYRETPLEITQLESEFVEVVEEAPPPPEPEPETPPPAPEPEPVRRAPVVREVARAPEPETPPPAAPPPAQETPVDFDGLVLGGENGSWTTQQASGNQRGDRIGTPGATVTGRSRQGTPGGAEGGTGNGGPELVAASDLRRGPTPPSSDALNGLLQRNYPEEAKRQGISGRARVAMVLDATGHVRRMRVIRESPAGQGFGAACRRTLLDAPAWEPAIGPDGRPAATEIPFNCEFDVHQ